MHIIFLLAKNPLLIDLSLVREFVRTSRHTYHFHVKLDTRAGELENLKGSSTNFSFNQNYSNRFEECLPYV